MDKSHFVTYSGPAPGAAEVTFRRIVMREEVTSGIWVAGGLDVARQMTPEVIDDLLNQMGADIFDGEDCFTDFEVAGLDGKEEPFRPALHRACTAVLADDGTATPG